jgi:hypothetical protein
VNKQPGESGKTIRKQRKRENSRKHPRRTPHHQDVLPGQAKPFLDFIQFTRAVRITAIQEGPSSRPIFNEIIYTNIGFSEFQDDKDQSTQGDQPNHYPKGSPHN